MSIDVSTNDSGPSTSERILVEASRLFRKFGYHATTTRDIATAVGIRQPSLFHHYPSKSAIVVALLESDLEYALAEARELAALDESATKRLYRYICHDIDRVASAPYELSGVYREDVFSDPDFRYWAAKRRELHSVLDSIVAQGVKRGEFVDIQPEIVREMIIGALGRVLSLPSDERAAESAAGRRIATILVRGISTDVDSVGEIDIDVLD